jgi:cytochrome c
LRKKANEYSIQRSSIHGCGRRCGLLVWNDDRDSGAQMLARQSGCLKCHAVDKKKDGPAYRDVAAKYKGKPEAETKLTHHITSGERVKFEDGHEEDHKVVKSKDPLQIKNLVDWILSLEGGTAPVEAGTKPVEGGKKP